MNKLVDKKSDQIGKDENGDIVLYTTKDIQRIFKVGITQSYYIMHAHGFPSFKINRTLYVEKSKLEHWIKNSTGREISV